jgi:hypothetical protein
LRPDSQCQTMPAQVLASTSMLVEFVDAVVAGAIVAI